MKRTFGTLFTITYFFTNCLVAHALETNIWAERQERLRASRSEKKQVQLASLPSAVSPGMGSQELIRQFPALNKTLAETTLTFAKNKVPPSTSSISSRYLKAIPAKAALIKKVHVENANAPFVLLLQDVHMNHARHKRI